MCKEVDTLAKYILTSLTTNSSSNGAVNEFTELCCKCIQESVQPDWTDNVAELWDYLTTYRTLPDKEYQKPNTAFHMGQLYACLDLLRILQKKREEECTLKEDAHFYSEHWYHVFTALGNGNSLTHKELAAACNLSDSSLSQFLHKIDKKNYIHFRKIGRTKYYRLSNRGQELLKHMKKEHAQHRLFSFTYGGDICNYLHSFETAIAHTPVMIPVAFDPTSSKMYTSNPTYTAKAYSQKLSCKLYEKSEETCLDYEYMQLKN